MKYIEIEKGSYEGEIIEYSYEYKTKLVSYGCPVLSVIDDTKYAIKIKFIDESTNCIFEVVINSDGKDNNRIIKIDGKEYYASAPVYLGWIEGEQD